MSTNPTDPRLLNLSYSSLLTAHSCPRKFELDRLGSVRETSESESESITFSYGHVVGLGIQCSLEDDSFDQILWKMFLSWKADLFAENIKQAKSFAHAVYAIQKFHSLRQSGYLNEYELVYHLGLPACELSFIIDLPNNFKYRGFVDAVLRSKLTGKVIVLECKTSSATTVNPATYKNSAQAIGYSIVLDSLFPNLSSYEVLYLIYSTKELQYEQLPFTKSYVQRARWIRELLLDVDCLTLYNETNLYPMRGESCFSYFRECQYLGLCHMETDRLVTPITPKQIETIEKTNASYQIKITLEELIQSQLTKTSTS